MAAAPQKKKKANRSADRRNLWLLVLTTLLVIGSVFPFTPPADKINQGLDIQGGLSVVLTAKGDDGASVSTEDMEKAARSSKAASTPSVRPRRSCRCRARTRSSCRSPACPTPRRRSTPSARPASSLRAARLVLRRRGEEPDREGQFGTRAPSPTSSAIPSPRARSSTSKWKRAPTRRWSPARTSRTSSIGKPSDTSTDYAVNVRLDCGGRRRSPRPPPNWRPRTARSSSSWTTRCSSPPPCSRKS